MRTRLAGLSVVALSLVASHVEATPPTVPPVPPAPQVVFIPPQASAPRAPRPRSVVRPPPATVTVDPTALAAARRAFASGNSYRPSIQDLAVPLTVDSYHFQSTVKPNPQPDYAGGKQSALAYFYDAHVLSEGEVSFFFPPGAATHTDIQIEYSAFYAVGEPVMLDCQFSMLAPRDDLKVTIGVNQASGGVSVPLVRQHAVATFVVPSVEFFVSLTLPRASPDARFLSCTLSPVF